MPLITVKPFLGAAYLDPYWGQTVVSMPFISDIKDYRGHSFTTYGAPALTTSTYKFPSKSLQFNGNGDFLMFSSALATTDLALGTGDFTLEAWIYPTNYINVNSSSSAFVLSCYDGGSGSYRWSFGITPTNVQFNLQYGNSGGNKSTFAGRAAPLNTWTHIAAVRRNGMITVYVNGVGGTAVAYADNLTFNAPIAIGRFINAVTPYYEQFKGNMQDLRITKAARYTANFTPPTSPNVEG